MTLDADLLAAHTGQDRPALVRLYAQAADQADDEDTACFYLTQAYIYALEAGDPLEIRLYDRLKAKARI